MAGDISTGSDMNSTPIGHAPGVRVELGVFGGRAATRVPLGLHSSCGFWKHIGPFLQTLRNAPLWGASQEITRQWVLELSWSTQQGDLPIFSVQWGPPGHLYAAPHIVKVPPHCPG